MRLDYFGLLHTNRQIRTEFQGIYYQATRIQIPLYNFQAFAYTLNLNKKVSFPWNGRLQIDIPDDGDWGYDAMRVFYFQEKHWD